jgi:hypothetical protein
LLVDRSYSKPTHLQLKYPKMNKGAAYSGTLPVNPC